ncbi:MAG: ATP synthase F1 subunit delta, partial [Clostridiales bacterium]|nr:ATP synthase F1 subunit delta [Clostridiales bacterium]
AIPRAERIKSIDSVFGGRVPDIVLAMLKMMCSKGHLNSVDRLVWEYEMLNRERKGIMLARVYSAVALSDEEKQKLRQGLKQRFGREVELDCTVDASLIGGIRVEADGKVIDGSIRYRLHQIKEVMDA